MNAFIKIQNILSDILDIDKDEINLESYLIRDLGAESIDLLEIAVALNTQFNIEIIDSKIYLKDLRLFVNEAKDKKITLDKYLLKKYSFLNNIRINEIINDLENGPVIKIKDMIMYIEGQ